MHQGHLHQWDDAYTLYHRPATRFVANFIGHGVFAPATLVQQRQRRGGAHAAGRSGQPDRMPAAVELPCG